MKTYLTKLCNLYSVVQSQITFLIEKHFWEMINLLIFC